MANIFSFLAFLSLSMVLVSGVGNLFPPAWIGKAELPAILLQIILAYHLLSNKPLPLLKDGEKFPRRTLLLCVALLFVLFTLRFQPLPAVLSFWRDACTSATLLLLGTVLGAWLIKGLQRPTELVPVCLVMACTDLLSVFAGPTGRLMQDVSDFYRTGAGGPPPLGDFFLVKFALPGGFHLTPVFGISDWIMVAFLSAAARRFNLEDNLLPSRSVHIPLALAGLLLAVSLARAFGWLMPALPLVSLVFLTGISLRQSQLWHLSQREWRLVCSIGGIVLSLSLWLWFSGQLI